MFDIIYGNERGIKMKEKILTVEEIKGFLDTYNSIEDFTERSNFVEKYPIKTANIIRERMAFEIKNNLLVKYIGIGSDERVVIPDNVTTISTEAFSDNENIKSVIIPDSVVCFGEGVFEDCEKLVKIVYRDKNYGNVDNFESLEKEDLVNVVETIKTIIME